MKLLLASRLAPPFLTLGPVKHPTLAEALLAASPIPAIQGLPERSFSICFSDFLSTRRWSLWYVATGRLLPALSQIGAFHTDRAERYI